MLQFLLFFSEVKLNGNSVFLLKALSGDAKEIGSTAHSRFQLQSSLAVRGQMGVLWG